MRDNNGASSLFEVGVKAVHVGRSATSHATLVGVRFGQFHWLYGTGLVCNEPVDALNFGRINKCTLHTNRLVAVKEKHIAAPDELIGTWAVENGTRVNHCAHLESHSSGEVCLDVTCDNACCWALGCYHHVYANGTCKLRNTCYRQLDFFAGGHDKVAELVDNHHDVGHVLVSLGEV